MELMLPVGRIDAYALYGRRVGVRNPRLTMQEHDANIYTFSRPLLAQSATMAKRVEAEIQKTRSDPSFFVHRL
jgi:hypothetical protein